IDACVASAIAHQGEPAVEIERLHASAYPYSVTLRLGGSPPEAHVTAGNDRAFALQAPVQLRAHYIAVGKAQSPLVLPDGAPLEAERNGISGRLGERGREVHGQPLQVRFDDDFARALVYGLRRSPIGCAAQTLQPLGARGRTTHVFAADVPLRDYAHPGF